jgi:tetratricopeptide (TPR) repeat protein
MDLEVLTAEALDDDDAARKRVKLHAAPPSCFHCGAAPATNRCSRCKAVHFCSRSCQQSAWPQHRRTCAPPKRSWADGAALWARALRESSGPLLEEAVRALRAAPESGDARTASRRATFLGYCRSDAGDAGGAAAYLERAVALDPSNGDAWRELLLVRERDEGDIVAAKAVVARCPGLWASPEQRPGYVERGLRAQPWWDGAQFPWVAALEAVSGEVRACVEINQ